MNRKFQLLPPIGSAVCIGVIACLSLFAQQHSLGAASAAQNAPIARDEVVLVGTSSSVEEATSPAQLDPPVVTLNVPSEVLIREDFTFTVTFKSAAGSAIGYGPYLDLYLPAWGADGDGPFSGTPQKCDGINFVSAETLFTNPPTVALASTYDSSIGGSPPCPYSTPTRIPFRERRF